MIRWVQLGTARVPGGDGELRLMQRGAEFSIFAGADELMGTRLSGSEEALASLTAARLQGRARPHILIGGLGMGFTMVPAMGAAMAVLPEDRAGVGSGLLQTLRQCAGAIGVALLGSMLLGIYTGRLDTTGLPSAAAHTAQGSVSAAQAVSVRLHDGALAVSAHGAFVHGMNAVLLVCGIAAALSALLIALRMPGALASDTDRP